MELEDLKKAWEELNSRVTRNELTNQRILTEMLMQRRESVTQYFSRWKKICIIFTVLIWTIVPSLIYIRNVTLVPSSLVLVVMLVSTILTFMGQAKWSKIMKWKDTGMEQQIRYVLEYKIFMRLNYIIVYILVIPVIIYSYCMYPYFRVAMFIALLIGFLLDVFIYHTTSDKLKDLSSTIRELEELKQLQ